jgi:2'-5' RNA ligase
MGDFTDVRNHWWWRPGQRVGRRFYAVHATFAAAAEVQEMAAQARDRLADIPYLDLIPGRWLHLTMQGLGFADEVGDGDLAAIAAAAAARLAMVPPVTITLGQPEVAGEGVTCWVSPPRALDQVRDAVRAGVADVWGDGRVPESPDWTPHVSVAYANADGPGGAIEAALKGMGGIETTVRAVDLIRLGRDNRVYEWETIASLPLG